MDGVDLEARGMAREAMQVISSHMAVCNEIAKNAAETRARIERAQYDLNEKVDNLTTRATWGLIAVLGSAVVFFLIPFFTK